VIPNRSERTRGELPIGKRVHGEPLGHYGVGDATLGRRTRCAYYTLGYGAV